MFIPDTVVIRFVIKRGFLDHAIKSLSTFSSVSSPVHWCCHAKQKCYLNFWQRAFAAVMLRFHSSCMATGAPIASPTSPAATTVSQVAIRSPHKVGYFFLHHHNSSVAHALQGGECVGPASLQEAGNDEELGIIICVGMADGGRGRQQHLGS